MSRSGGESLAPGLDLRSAIVLIPWLGGGCLISYLGNYPEESTRAGNLAVFGTSGLALVWAAVAILVMTAVSYGIASALRLPSERVAEHNKGAPPAQAR